MGRRVSNGLEREKEGEEGSGLRGRETGQASQLGLGRVWAAGGKGKRKEGEKRGGPRGMDREKDGVGRGPKEEERV
jgi:hypothetical protein